MNCFFLNMMRVFRVIILPKNTVAVAAAETSLVVYSLIGHNLFHFIHSFPTLETDVLHRCNLSTDTVVISVKIINNNTNNCFCSVKMAIAGHYMKLSFATELSKFSKNDFRTEDYTQLNKIKLGLHVIKVPVSPNRTK